jgi:hypothetical protein
MVDQQKLEELEALEAAASAAPWHISNINDDLAMSAVAVTKNPSTGREFDAFPEWVAEDIVAACLIQSNARVGVDDKCWQENARLIAAMRNALPELLRLAKIGLSDEQRSQQP